MGGIVGVGCGAGKSGLGSAYDDVLLCARYNKHYKFGSTFSFAFDIPSSGYLSFVCC